MIVFKYAAVIGLTICGLLLLVGLADVLWDILRPRDTSNLTKALIFTFAITWIAHTIYEGWEKEQKKKGLKDNLRDLMK